MNTTQAPAERPTRLSDWNTVRGEEHDVTLLYTRFFIGVLLYFVITLAIAIGLNAFGDRDWVWAVLLISTFVDLWILFHPLVPGSLAVAGYIRGQAGGDPGLSVGDGIKSGLEWVKGYAQTVAIVILGKQFALVMLALLPIRGFGAIAIALLALTILAIIGTLRFSKEPWIIKKFWHFYIALIAIIVVYWVIASIFPQAMVSPAKAVVNAAERNVQLQYDRDLKMKMEAVKSKVEGMADNLTLKQRLARLTPEERQIWEQADNGSFMERSIDATLQSNALGSVRNTFRKAGDEVKDLVNGHSASRGFEKTVELKPGIDFLSPIEVCGLPSGTWRYTVTQTPVQVKTPGWSSPLYFTIEKPNSWALLLNAKLPGQTVMIDSSGCGKAQFDVPTQQQLFVGRGEYQLANEGTVVLHLN